MANIKNILWSPPMRQQNSLGVSDSFSTQGHGFHPAVHPSFPSSLPKHPGGKNEMRGGYTMNMTKPSLWMITFALMLLGICFFGSGFFVGWWMGGKNASDSLTTELASATGGGASASSSGKNRLGPLLEIIGAAGGNVGRMAWASQRALDRDAQNQRVAGNRTPAMPGQASAGSGVGAVVTSGGASSGYPSHPALSGEQGGGQAFSGGSQAGSSAFSPTHPGEASFSSNNVAGSPKGNVDPTAPQVSYAIQLGAYATKENAIDLMARLRTRFITTYLVEGKDTDGTPVFFVRTGSYGHFNIAETTAVAISEQEQVTAVVVANSDGEKRISP